MNSRAVENLFALSKSCHHLNMEERFITLADVATTLNVAPAAVYALVRSGELPAIKIGARGQWRVELTQLENYIARMYVETSQFVATHPR